MPEDFRWRGGPAIAEVEMLDNGWYRILWTGKAGRFTSGLVYHTSERAAELAHICGAAKVKVDHEGRPAIQQRKHDHPTQRYEGEDVVAV